MPLNPDRLFTLKQAKSLPFVPEFVYSSTLKIFGLEILAMAVTTCKICDKSEDNPVIIAREMMFGKRDEFEYFQCLRCGC